MQQEATIGQLAAIITHEVVLHYKGYRIEGTLYKWDDARTRSERYTEEQFRERQSFLSVRYLVKGRVMADGRKERGQLMVFPFLAEQVTVQANTITVKSDVLLDTSTGPDKEYGHA